MKHASLAFAAVALITGLVAAWYWFKASAVKVEPLLGRFGPMANASDPFVAGALDAIERSAALNKTAALWTAASVLCSGITSVAGAL